MPSEEWDRYLKESEEIYHRGLSRFAACSLAEYPEARESLQKGLDDCYGRWREKYFAALSAQEIDSGRKRQFVLNELKTHRFDLEAVYELHLDHLRTPEDRALERWVEKPTKVESVARKLRDAAAAFRTIQSLQLPFRQGEWMARVSPAAGPNLSSLLRAMPNSYRLILPDTRHAESSRFAALEKASSRSKAFEWHSPLQLAADLIDLFRSFDLSEIPSDATGEYRADLEYANRYDTARLEDAVHFLKQRAVCNLDDRPPEWLIDARRSEPEPKDVEYIAALIDDLADQTVQAAALLKRRRGEKTNYRERSFRAAFASLSKCTTGHYHDEIGAGLFSVSFLPVSTEQYRRDRQRARQK